MGAKKTPVLFVNQACTCVVSNYIPNSFCCLVLNPPIVAEKNKFDKWISRRKRSKVKTEEHVGEEDPHAERMETGGTAG